MQFISWSQRMSRLKSKLKSLTDWSCLRRQRRNRSPMISDTLETYHQTPVPGASRTACPSQRPVDQPKDPAHFPCRTLMICGGRRCGWAATALQVLPLWPVITSLPGANQDRLRYQCEVQATAHMTNRNCWLSFATTARTFAPAVHGAVS